MNQLHALADTLQDLSRCLSPLLPYGFYIIIK